MSLLSIVTNSAKLLSIPVPTTVVTSSDTQVQLLLALGNEEGQELAAGHDWQQLTQEGHFTTVAAEEQPGAAPADLDHFIANSLFDRSTLRELIGPITPQQWQAIKAWPQMNRVYLSWRERDGSFLITPIPTAGDDIYFEYVSNGWALSNLGAVQSEFLADTDTSIWPDRIFQLGIRWRFRKSKNLPYAEDFKTYQVELQKLQSKDGGMTRLDSTGRSRINLWGNIAEGSWPGPGNP